MRERVVMVIGGGGREHALVDAYARDVDRLIAVPGNDAMRINTDKPLELFPNLKTTSVAEIVAICQREIERGSEILADVAQDNAVAAGVVDILNKIGVPVVGPTRAAGEIEWSKAYQREFGQAEGILQPSFRICQTEKEGIEYITSQPDQPWFIKADGLAEGKGALPAKSNREAIEKIRELRKRFPKAAQTYLIEKWLRGDTGIEEFSGYAISDGTRFRTVGFAEDHKRVNNHDARDEGENTGGMGCNTLFLPDDLWEKVQLDIFKKTFEGLAARGRPYKGVLYLGGMIVKNGERNPSVIEFNARWGDPEAQIIVPSLVINLFEVGMAIAQGDISRFAFKTDGKARVVVTGASRGYPDSDKYKAIRGKEISGINHARKNEGITIYGAGMRIVDGKYFASGGRLFYVVAEGKTVAEAQERAYDAMSFICIEDNGLHYRTDIGWRAIQRETTAT